MAAARERPTIKISKIAIPLDQLPVPDGKKPFACGSGNMGFNISKIKAELTTTLLKSTGLSGEVNPTIDVVTIDLKGANTTGTTNTQTLDY